MPALKGILQEAMPSLGKGKDKGKGKAKESRGTEQGERSGSIFSSQGIGQDQDQEIGDQLLIPGWQKSRQVQGHQSHIPGQPSRQGGDGNTHALQVMQTLLKDPNATWKSREQKACMVTVLQGSTDLIAVLGTGADKSMLAVVPSIMQPNQATKVAMVIFDKAHIPLMTKSYQVALQNIHELQSIPMQLVLLSATLPPWVASELVQEHVLEVLETESASSTKVPIATTAFSAGSDYPHVQTVIHMGKPFDMGDYVQGQGRAGQDGEPANCYTVIPLASSIPNIQSAGLERGRGQLGHLQIAVLLWSKEIKQQITQLEEGEKMLAALQSFEGRCSLCTTLEKGNGGNLRHGIRECPNLAGDGWSNYVQWRRELRYQNYHKRICYVCHVPQINDVVHPQFTRAGKDVVAPAAYGAYLDAELCWLASMHFEQSWQDEVAFARWLMGHPRPGYHSNLINLFMWYHQWQQAKGVEG
ncbi:hypothetical protein EDD17DRAFT_1844661 [Pisolithus thermaeus]|nr:hypothetical protein EV401DRAFT_1893705 [Pisolithus croceorrhizus]KAI6158457.1 hypothetical protein EDD17DRAFT_1844661 [Pisolithus thermaeus]